MLQFFRKYQKFIFLFTTIVIISSFVFFGSYQSFAPSFRKKEKDEVAFVSVNGKKIHHSYLNHMSAFLSSEGSPQLNKILSTNFLNDGVISKDFLETGLGSQLVEYFPDAMMDELQSRLEKEKMFRPYVHPYFKSLSAESIWKQYAPDIAENLQKLQKGSKASDAETFETRANLFLAERRFPPSFLTQVLRYQERDHSNFPPDPRLMKGDLRLFGYRDLTDWFGSRFIECISQVIINTAAMARQLGYRVSQEEVISDLLYQSEKAYEMLRDKIELPFNNGYGFFQLYLQQKGLDEKMVVKIWQDIILFRRILHEVGNAALVDVHPLQQFYNYAHEYLTVELFQLSPELRFQTFDELKRFESYLEAVGQPRPSILDLPLTYRSVDDIESQAPELVGKQYHLYVREVTKQALEAKVSIKEMLGWEYDHQNWNKLTERFHELDRESATPFEALEKLQPKTRKHIDTFARKQIVDAHPQWLEEAIRGDEMEEKELFLTSKTKEPLPGITDPMTLRELLDQENEIMGYSQDEEHYFRILVKGRAEEKEIMTFKQALKEEVLNELTERFQGEVLANRVVAALTEGLNLQDLNDNELNEYCIPFRFAPYLSQDQSITSTEGELVDQWKVVKKQKTLTRSEPSFISFEQATQMEPEAVSQIDAVAGEGAYFYRLLDKNRDISPPLDKIREKQELLSKEVRRHYLEKVLAEMKEKKAFVFE